MTQFQIVQFGTSLVCYLATVKLLLVDGHDCSGSRAMLFNLRQEWRREVPAAHVAAACARLDPALLGLLGYTCDGGIDGAAPSP